MSWPSTAEAAHPAGNVSELVLIASCWVAPDAETYGITGGNAEITLTVEQMPSHTHPYRDIYWSNAGNGTVPTPTNPRAANTDRYKQSIDFERTSDEAGGGQPVEILPPYIALTFCRRAGVNSSDNTDE